MDQPIPARRQAVRDGGALPPADSPPPSPAKGPGRQGIPLVGRIRIAPTLAVIFAGLVTGTALITSASLMVSSLGVAKNSTATRLRDVSRLLASQIDGEALAGLTDPDQQQSETYRRIHEKLNQAVGKIQGVRYIYTLRRAAQNEDGKVSKYLFIVDGLPFKDEEFQPIGTEMETAESTDALHRVWESGKLEVDRDFVTDKWGTWLSGYIPLRKRDGSFEAVLGIDISASDVEKNRTRIIRTLTGGYLISILMMIPAAAFFGSRISGPLRRINQRLQTISLLEFDRQPQMPVGAQWVREIHEISESLGRVEGALQDFNRYVPSRLVRKLVLEKTKIQLDGEVRNLAIMFTDIMGFVGTTERMSAHSILSHLNQYFSVINDVAELTQGILDKYFGDAALLFWGAPDYSPSPASSCLEAALLCQQRLEALNQHWKQQGEDVEFPTSIGIDYGEVVIGNMGAEQRVNYTIIGDRVNLASRIEAINRRYGTRLLATRALIEALGKDVDRYLIVKIDDAKLRGISHAVELFEVRGHLAQATDQEKAFVRTFTEAYNLLDAGNASAALQALHSLDDYYRDLAYVKCFEQRCRGGQDVHDVTSAALWRPQS